MASLGSFSPKEYSSPHLSRILDPSQRSSEKTWAYAFYEGQLLKGGNKPQLIDLPPFEKNEEYENHNYIILFNDHPKGEGVLISPRSIQRMRVEKGELPGVDARFEFLPLMPEGVRVPGVSKY